MVVVYVDFDSYRLSGGGNLNLNLIRDKHFIALPSFFRGFDSPIGPPVSFLFSFLVSERLNWWFSYWIILYLLHS